MIELELSKEKIRTYENRETELSHIESSINTTLRVYIQYSEHNICFEKFYFHARDKIKTFQEEQ